MKLKITGTCVFAVLALVLCASANANQITYAQTVFNTNFATSDIGLRDVGAGDLTVSGITGTVTQSLLFWHGPTNSTDPAANASVTVGGQSVTGTNIGFSQDNFWGSLNSQAYRADVTSVVTGNGTVALSNFQKPNVQVNGAALFTFFNTGLSTGKRDVVLFEGNDSNFASSFDPAGWDATLSGIKYSGGSAFLTMYVSDGQNFAPDDDGTLRINGTQLATGGIFQGLSPKAPGAGVDNGSLTDVETFDITSFLSPGSNSLHITLDAGFDDALSAVVFAIDLPAGDAPPPPGVPEPSSLALLSLGLLCTWRMRRTRTAA
jgi:PEP-CTERM motif